MSRGFDWIYWAIGALVGLGGLALLLWSLFADRPRARRRCPKCWYDLTGSPHLTCSECGYAARGERSLRKTRRRWRWAIAALPLIVAGYLVGVTPRIRAHWGWYGWRGAIPTTALLAAQAHLDERLAEILEARVMQGGAWGWQNAWYARIKESRYLRARGMARVPALQHLAELGSAAQGCLPTVFAAARDPDPPVRAVAAYAIGSIQSDPDPSLAMLVSLLRDESAMVRQSAASALWTFARQRPHECAAAAPALREALQDDSEWGRLHSAMALAWVTGDAAPAVSATTSALNGTDRDLGIAATLFLGELDPAHAGVVPTLSNALRHAEPRVRRAAVLGLRRAGPRAAEAVPILVELLKDREIDNYVQVARTLGEIGPAAAPAVTDLERLRYDPSPEASQAAEAALEKIRRAS